VTQRLHWADIAKAGAIVLVVVYHVGSTGLSELTEGENAAKSAWAAVNAALVPVRMPLFFLISGVLAVGAIQRRWTEVWRKRVADLLWPFALWTLAFAVPYALAYATGGITGTTLEAASWTFVAAGAYWYLPALIVFFLATWLLRNTPMVLLGFAIALHAAAPMIRDALGDAIDPDVRITIYRWATFLVWFALGATARKQIEYVAHLPAYVAVVTASVYVFAAILVYQYGWTLTPVLNVLGVVTALIASAQFARFARPVRLGRYLAKRTLPIYLIHPILLAIMVAVGGSLIPNTAVLSAVAVPVLVVALTWASVKLYDSVTGRADWLFRFPQRQSVGAEAGYGEGPPAQAQPLPRPAGGVLPDD